MSLNPNSLVRIFIVIFVVTMGWISYKVYQQVIFVQNQRRQLINNFYDPNLENFSYADALDTKYSERRMNVRRIMRIKTEIKKINLNQRVYNTHFLKPVTNGTYIIVIQVHSNVFLLRQLLSAMKVAHSISKALLIFSHDFYDNEINKAIQGINFAKYMQIFYPYSTQLHPYVFPGLDRDCHDGIMCNRSRDPAAAQMKHHWWWQVNQVFDNLEVTKNHTNTILFLEEDNYVTPDFLVMHKLLENVRNVHCPVCEMISLGAHDPDISQYMKKRAMITLEVWGERMHKLGIAFDRAIWYSIKTHSQEFCYFNDYTWDNSLKYVGSKYMDTNFYFTVIDAPRAFRIEKCDDNDRNCKLEYKVEEVKKFIALVNHAMFPWVVELKILASDDYTVKPLGYFDDDRDHELCMYFTKKSVWF